MANATPLCWDTMGKKKRQRAVNDLVSYIWNLDPNIPIGFDTNDKKQLLNGAIIDQVRINGITHTRLVLYLADVMWCRWGPFKDILLTYLEGPFANANMEHLKVFTQCIIPFEQLDNCRRQHKWTSAIWYYFNMSAVNHWLYLQDQVDHCYYQDICNLYKDE